MNDPTRDLAAVRARLDALVDWERRDRDARMRPSLAPARDLVARLGHPERAELVVHVAGSKGKGSVCALVDAALRRAGRRTGRYASPHVERLNERVVAGGVEVSDAALAAALTTALDARDAAVADGTDGRDATWFDVLTAAAFVAFRAAGCDALVVECGLGGRLDSTNVVAGTVCAITSIDLEHTAVLGGTRGAIAREKAGILEPGATVVAGLPHPDTGDEAARAVAERAAELGCDVAWVAPGGPLSARNRALAAAVLDALAAAGRVPGGRALLEGLEAPLPGRAERLVAAGVPVVLDGAHTPGSLAALLDDLAAEPALAGPCTAVLGLGRDKDATGVLKVLGARADRILCTSAGTGLSLPSGELAAKAGAFGKVENHPDPRVAVQRALDLARGGWVLVTGSLHLVGAVRPGLQGRARDPRC